MSPENFLEKFDLIADAPGAVAMMRELVLNLAVQGKLVPQDPNDKVVPTVEEFRRATTTLSSAIGIRSPKEPSEEAESTFDVPDCWSWMALADIGAAQTGTTPSKSDHSAFNGDVPFIKPADILPNYVDYSNESLTRKGAEDGSRLAPAGSLLMVCIGTIGKCNLIDRECAFNQQINSISPVEWVDPRYLLIAVRASYFQEAAWSKSSSTTIAILNKGKWLSIPIPLPPLAEQKRIVAKVDELMSLCDRLEQQQKEREAQHAALSRASLTRFSEAPTTENLNFLFHPTYTTTPADLRKTILTLAVQGKLVPQYPNDELVATSLESEMPFEIPTNWQWCRLGSLGLCRTGKTPPTSDPTNYGMGFPFIGPGQITSNGNFTLPEKTITKKGLVNSTEANVPDILMVCIGGSIGKAAICREYIGFNQQINSVRLTRDLPEFVYLAVTSDYFQAKVLTNASGSATPIINKSKWERIAIPIPPLAEQKRIVAKVDELMKLVDQLEAQLSTSRTTAENLLNALLADLTSQKAA